MRVRIVRVVAIVSALVLGVAACGDDDGEASSSTTSPVGDATSDGDVSSADDAEQEGDGDGSEMSDDDRERVARALLSTVGADGYEIDGDTLVYIFEDGSSEDPGVDVNCMSMIAIQGAFELVLLQFPDGTHECGIATLE